MPKTCKILILGKTGVGKSALLNYLAGEKLAESGLAHKSGGITRGINRYHFKISGYNCAVSDSEGLETGAGDYEQWKNIIEYELEKSKSSLSIYDWYHVVIFCISAGGGRVEPCEIKCIKRLVEEGYGVVVAFTKADQSSENDTKKLMADIGGELFTLPRGSLKFIDVCSVEKKMNSFGMSQLSEAIISQWRMTLTNRLPEHIFGWTSAYLDAKKQEIKNWLWNQKMGTFGREPECVARDVNSKIKSVAESVAKTLEAMYREAEDAINEVAGLFNNMLPGMSAKIRLLLNSLSIKNTDSSSASSSEFGDIGTAVAGILAAPIILAAIPIMIPVAFFAVLFDKGNKEKRKICGAIDEKFNELRTLLETQRVEFKEKLRKTQKGV